MQTGSYEFDMTSVNSMLWLRAEREGLAEPIDWTIVKENGCPPGAVVANGHGIASNILGTNLCYRSDKFPHGGPKSWADFWDVERFPGNRGLCVNDSPRSMIFALLADGVPRDKLYPLDFERAFKTLDRIKPHIKVWWREGNQSQQLIRDGEVDMMSIWNARASELKEQGVPVELVGTARCAAPAPGASLKGAPNRKLAWEFISFASGEPKPQAEFNTRLYYGPIHPDAYELIPPASRSSFRPTPATSLSRQGGRRVGSERIAGSEERFTQWLAS